jgi:hypothetical protein
MALNVILVHFNPKQLRVRKRLFLETARRLELQGAKVTRVEAAFSDRPFEVTSWWNPHHVRVRTDSELWNKEALINIGAKYIFERYSDNEYVAWVDADVAFCRPDWAQATEDLLKHYPVVQMFGNAVDLDPRYDFMGRAKGFAKLYGEGQKPGDFEKDRNRYPYHMHPGYAWAWRREEWEAVGGMITTGILGSGDHHMANALIGFAAESVWAGLHPGYSKPIIEWGQRAAQVVHRNVGVVDGLIVHHFHGYKEHRGYRSRVDILREYQFNPETDLTFDKQGMPQLVGNKPGLGVEIQKYMGSRREYDLAMALNEPRHRHIHF